MRKITYFLAAITCLTFLQLKAEEPYYEFDDLQPKEECKECRGKFDTGPAYINIDVLQRGKTFRSLDLMAWKADATYKIWSGLTVKAGGMYGGGDAHFYTLSGAIGFCIPIDRFTIFPNVGYSGGNFKSTFDMPLKVEVSGLEKPIKFKFDNVKETIDSHGPIIGVDLSYKISQTWRAIFVFVYAWSKVDTEYKWNSDSPLFPDIDEHFRTKTSGPNYAFVLEHDLADNLSVNIGLGYNMSLSKDKEGLRAKGAKFGVVYWW